MLFCMDLFVIIPLEPTFSIRNLELSVWCIKNLGLFILNTCSFTSTQLVPSTRFFFFFSILNYFGVLC